MNTNGVVGVDISSFAYHYAAVTDGVPHYHVSRMAGESADDRLRLAYDAAAAGFHDFWLWHWHVQEIRLVALELPIGKGYSVAPFYGCAWAAAPITATCIPAASSSWRHACGTRRAYPGQKIKDAGHDAVRRLYPAAAEWDTNALDALGIAHYAATREEKA